MRIKRDADRDGCTHVPDEQVAGRIALTAGSHMPWSDGTLTLTTDGTALWYHPGYYDDYRRVEGVIDDPDIIRRVRALLDSGDRTRTHEGQIPTRYQVTTSRSTT